MYQTSTHDLFSDALFILNDRLMFASLYGRDANILSFFAALNTNAAGGTGVHSLGFREAGSKTYFPMRTTAKHLYNLHKHMTKIHTQNYGVLVHAFVYAGEITQLDHDGKTAWLVSDNLQNDLAKQAWRIVTELADVPLLDSWANAVLPRLQQQDCLTLYPPGVREDAALIGLQACRVRIPEDFDQQISSWIKTGILLPN